jgi:hypothetical protein
MAFSRTVSKGISHMGTTYFLLLVAVCLGGALLVLRRINSNSYLLGQKSDGVEYEQSKATKRKASLDEEVDHPRVLAYVDWYFKKFESGSDSLENAFAGTAFVANDALGETSGMETRAVH